MATSDLKTQTKVIRVRHKGTHDELVDPQLRQILANELRLLHIQKLEFKKARLPLPKDYYSLIATGLDTALRRVQDVGEYGMENVYRQFHPAKEKKQ
jgi:hypothetical protein